MRSLKPVNVGLPSRDTSNPPQVISELPSSSSPVSGWTDSHLGPDGKLRTDSPFQNSHIVPSSPQSKNLFCWEANLKIMAKSSLRGALDCQQLMWNCYSGDHLKLRQEICTVHPSSKVQIWSIRNLPLLCLHLLSCHPKPWIQLATVALSPPAEHIWTCKRWARTAHQDPINLGNIQPFRMRSFVGW